MAGEARAGEDFILSTDEMVFLPGETAKSFTVEGVGSSPYDELLALRLVSHSDEVGVCGGGTDKEKYGFRTGVCGRKRTV